MRNHGPSGRYHSHYPDKTLREWAGQFARWAREGRTVFCYFDNDQKKRGAEGCKQVD